MTTTALEPIEAQQIEPIASPNELSVRDVLTQVAKIQQVMHDVMKSGEHYGTIPGCGDKPTLLKAGAEKIGFTFRIMPRYIIERIDMSGGHREYVVTCELYHVHTGAFVGSGVGSCSTMEGKYRFRTGPKEFTGKPVPHEYWNTRETNPQGAQKIIGGPGLSVGKNPDTGQWEVCRQGERVEHDNPADYYNTVLKMSKKRAHVDAVLTSTAASDIFTQDLEDLKENGVVGTPATKQAGHANGGSTVQQPQRKSQNGNGKPDMTGMNPAVMRAMCEDIAQAGYTIRTDDYKTFALSRATEIETADTISVKISSFMSKGKVVTGRKPEDLSPKAFEIASEKVKSAWDALQKLQHTEDAGPGPQGEPNDDPDVNCTDLKCGWGGPLSECEMVADPDTGEVTYTCPHCHALVQ